MRIAIINGPNLNMLGQREPEIYGNQNLADLIDGLQSEFPDAILHHFQSNIEGELINAIQACHTNQDAVILNAGGYTHTSVAIADAISAIDTPVIEVHISNVHAREEFRKHSLLSAKCHGTISGLGMDSYRLAIHHFITSHG